MKTGWIIVATFLIAGLVNAAHPTFEVDVAGATKAGITIVTQGQDSVTFSMSAPLQKNGNKLFTVELLIGERKTPLVLTTLAFQEVETGRASWQFTLGKDQIEKMTVTVTYGPRGGETYVVKMNEPTTPPTVQ